MSSYIEQIKPVERLNIYRIAAGFLYHRLKWDLTGSARKSKKYLNQVRNTHQGKKAVILCNGPSLNKVDFDALKRDDVFVIGLNKINLLFSRTDFRPDLIVAVNKLVIEQNQEFFNETKIPVLLDSYGSRFFGTKKHINYLFSLPFQLRFAANVSGSVCQGYTVTYVALQVAYHLGFSEVALVGCDHNFETKGSPNMKVTSGETDPNHFAPEYFSKGMEWQLPDLLGSEIHYKMADEYYRANGRKVINATDGGKLEIYERKTLTEFLNG